MNYTYWIGLIFALIVGFVIGAIAFGFQWYEGVYKYMWIVVAGGFGGMIHGLIEDGGSGKFRVPRNMITAENDVVADLGIFGELLIGMMGAMVSILVIAIFLGTDPFLDPDSDISVFRLIGFGALAGFAARQFLPNMAKRFSDQMDNEFRIKTNEAEKRIEKKAETEAAGQQARAEYTRLPAATPPNVAAMAAPAVQTVDDLQTYVQEFAGITYETHPDPQTRVDAMRELADRMVQGLPATSATKEAISQRVETPQQKVWLLPLATLIASRPEAGDASLLFDAYDKALNDASDRNKSKFILYRILLAIISMHDAFLLPAEKRPHAKKIAQACSAIDDSSLRKRAEFVLEMLK